MDDELVCNYKKCRKRLNGVAWVTSCSHVFCEEDGTREFGKQSMCPACDTPLPGQFDIVKMDMRPSEQYKSMVLAGQRPEVIMEICSRAMSFWTYQAHQERAYQEYLATKAVEKTQQQESYYEQQLVVSNSESATLKSQVMALKKDLEAIKTKCNETSEKLLEKTRQYQKLQGMYETLRRRSITPASFDGDQGGRGTPRLHRPPFMQYQFELPLGVMADKDAPLPHNLHRRQITGPMALTVENTALSSSSSHGHIGGVGGIHLDSNLAAAVSSQSHVHQPAHTTIHQVEGSKAQEHFTIKMSAPTHHHPTASSVQLHHRITK